MKFSWVPAVLMLGFFACLSIGAARHDAPTFDEAGHLAAGYSFWKTGSYWVEDLHPPLARLIETAPLLFLPLRLDPHEHPGYLYRFSDDFLFNNTRPFTEILFLGRLMTIALAVALGLLVWRWTAQALGEPAALAALAAYATSPVLIAHGHLLTNDMALGLFYTGALYTLWIFLQEPSAPRAFIAGLLASLALTAKFSGVVLFPTTAILLVASWRTQVLPWRQSLRYALVYAGALALGVAAVYQFHALHAFLHGFLALGSNLSGGRAAFLAGHYSTRGWPWYFIAAFLMKTPLPFLLALGIALAHLCFCPRRKFLLLWIYGPAVFYLASASFSPTQIGVRHILLLYPLLCIAIGDAAQHLGSGSRIRRAAAAVLGLWLFLDCALAYPFYIAYFNELVGGSAQGYRYLVDSNLDWGQELGTLSRYMKDHAITGLYLSYFGNTDPHAYGIRYRAILPASMLDHPDDAALDLKQQPRVLMAISATNLQGVYFRDHSYLIWLKERRPVAVLGHSLFIYDLTDDADAHAHLAAVYALVGRTRDQRYELQWSQELLKKENHLKLNLRSVTSDLRSQRDVDFSLTSEV